MQSVAQSIEFAVISQAFGEVVEETQSPANRALRPLLGVAVAASVALVALFGLQLELDIATLASVGPLAADGSFPLSLPPALPAGTALRIRSASAGVAVAAASSAAATWARSWVRMWCACRARSRACCSARARSPS